MALSDLDVKDQYAADGIDVDFAIPYTNIYDDSVETIVYIDDILQVEGSAQDYILTGRPDVDSFHTNVRFAVAPVNLSTVTVIRRLTLNQTLNLISAGSVNLATLEKHLDGITALIQQLDEKLNRVPMLKETTNETTIPTLPLPDPVALYMLGWNASADAIINVDRTEISGALPIFNPHSITDGQSAAALAGETVDGAVYSSAILTYEVRRGTTVFATGEMALHYVNSTWRLVDGGYEGDAHGITFSILQTTTNVSLLAALDVGAGSGTIKISTVRIAV